VARRRLFVAAELDDRAREACAHVAGRLRARRWPGRWVAPENYHLTVAFLGGIEDERVAAVGETLRALAPEQRPFALTLDAVGAFPSTARPRVAWAGPRRPVAAFIALSTAVREALSELGFVFEERAEPHVTLARADGRTPLPPVAAPATALRVERLTLFESFTESAGARYVPLERFDLGSGEQA
jgi:2'-5' RNA ligase